MGYYVSAAAAVGTLHKTVSSGHGQMCSFFDTAVRVSTGSCMPVSVNVGTTCAHFAH